MSEVTFDDAMDWLEMQCDLSETKEEQEIVEYIQDVLWQASLK